MALYKEIKLENGVVVKYHRIVSINKITNNCNIIEVASYISKEKRDEEKAYYESESDSQTINVFINTEYMNKQYNEEETIKDAYNYLKTTDKFVDAEDI